MKVAIMQPYFFPYIGYFQLMAAVDIFVFLDDAQYTQRGWMNRNRILQPTGACWWTRPVHQNAPRQTPINRRNYSRDGDDRLLSQLASAYGRSELGRPLIERTKDWLSMPETNVAEFNIKTLTELAGDLGISPAWQRASELTLPDGLRGQERILAICQTLGSSHYVNAIGGIALYRGEDFSDRGVQLSFLCTDSTPDTFDGDQLYFSVLHELSTRPLSDLQARIRQYHLAHAIASGGKQ